MKKKEKANQKMRKKKGGEERRKKKGGEEKQRKRKRGQLGFKVVEERGY